MVVTIIATANILFITGVLSSICSSVSMAAACASPSPSCTNLWDGRVHRYVTHARFNNLRLLYKSGKDIKWNLSAHLTKSDAKFEAAKQLFLAAAQFEIVIEVLNDFCDVYSDPYSSKTKIIQTSCHHCYPPPLRPPM